MKKEDNMTAEEFFEEWLENDEKYGKTNFHDCMIEFAKYHVQKALEEASEQAKVESEPDYRGGSWEYVDKDSILNSYPLENIK